MLAIKNAAYLFVSNVLFRLFYAAATILCARYMGTEDFGIFSTALAFSLLCGNLSDLGLTNTLIREANKERADLSVLIASYLKVRLAFSLAVSVAVSAVIWFAYRDPNVRHVMFWMVLGDTLGIALQGTGLAFFQAIQRMKYNAAIKIVCGVLTSSALLICYAMKLELADVALFYGLASVAGGLVSMLFVVREAGVWRGWDRSILSGYGSFLLSGIVLMLLPQLGPTILQRVASFEEVGLFSAAFRLTSALYIIPGVVAGAFYPMLFRYANERNYEQHRNVGRLQVKLMTALSTLTVLPLFLYADWWIGLLFGDGWERSAVCLRILSVFIIVKSISQPLGDLVTALGKQLARSVVFLIALAFGIAAYMAMGRVWGGVGGAVAALSIECVIVFGVLVIARAYLSVVYHGFRTNLVAMLLAASTHYFCFRHVHPVVGIVAVPAVFGLLAAVLDSQIRTRLTRALAWGGRQRQRSYR